MKANNNFSNRINFIFILMLMGALFSQSLRAQNANISKAPMNALKLWVGEWKGEGWSMDESRTRVNFTIEESIKEKLGGYALLIEGDGKDKVTKEPVHSALALFYYNTDKKTYEMKSLVDLGMTTLATAAIVNDKFVWGFEVQGGKIEYTITIDGDHWNEKGAFVMGNGQEFPIMEMNLIRVK